MDDKTCLSNEICSQNLWWVWTLSILWFAVFSLSIVVSYSKQGSGSISCVLFFLQMSSFASGQDESPNGSNNGSKFFGLIAQFNFIFSLTSQACWAPSMSAYSATVAKLAGPFFVLIFATAWTRMLHQLQPLLQRRSIELNFSYSGTLAVMLLFVFSRIAGVVFTLVTCTSNGVVFIDGNVLCYNITWWFLIGVVVILCLVPIVFAAALRWNRLPEQARSAVCFAYTDHMYYWGAATLGFRLLMSITPLLVPVQYPNISAFVHAGASLIMLVLVVHFRPYVKIHTLWVDISCYVRTPNPSTPTPNYQP